MTDRLFAVADGMGGHSGGEVASEVAVTAMSETEPLTSLDDLVAAVHRTNERVVDRSRDDPALRGMGTTITVLGAVHTPTGPRLGIANVGDSRLYLHAVESITQLTEDHSLVETLVRDGRLTRDEADVHPQRNILTRALGIDEKVLVDAWELVPVVGDRFVICSDGLFNELSNDEMTAILDAYHDPAEAAQELVDAANRAGGRDNITVVVVDIAEAPSLLDVPDDRVAVTRKAVPEGVLRVDPPGAGDEAVPPADPHPDEIPVDRSTPPMQFMTWRLAVFVAAVLMVFAVLLTSIVVYARSGYFVGDDGQQVVIYKGREGGVLWFDATVEEVLPVRVDQLRRGDGIDLLDDAEFDSLEAARRFVDGLPLLTETDAPVTSSSAAPSPPLTTAEP